MSKKKVKKKSKNTTRKKPSNSKARSRSSKASAKSIKKELSISPQKFVADRIETFENGILALLNSQELPAESIFIPVDERAKVFANLPPVVAKLKPEEKSRSIYLSKFIAASACGLFDAALNYLWDETILQLRSRVAQYDITYFYSQAVPSADRRQRLTDVSDLDKITDNELIQGAKKVELISDLGFQHLDYIRFMRNWASAAHPNQNEITGLQLISWLETCIKEVLQLPLSKAAIEIHQLLNNIRHATITESEARQISVFFDTLTDEQVNNFTFGLFSIYTNPSSSARALENIINLLEYLHRRVSTEAKERLGVRYGRFVANSDAHGKEKAREFIEGLKALEYIPEDLRAVEIDAALEALLEAHRGMNNFYNEPIFAENLKRIVENPEKIPLNIRHKYVTDLVYISLGNGYGVSHQAQPIYMELIAGFDSDLSLLAATAFMDSLIASKLQHSNLARENYREILESIEGKIRTPAAKKIVAEVKKLRNNMGMARSMSNIKRLHASINRLK